MEDLTVLRFCDVPVRPESQPGTDAGTIRFALDKGELALILLAGCSRDIPLCDLAEGLLDPEAGRIEFTGERWSDMTYARQSAARGKIGRVFEGQGWISNLSVYDNIVLSQRHHTLRSEDDMRREVERLAQSAGVSSVPEQLPDAVSSVDLRPAQWIRAFLGAPRLVLLEQPEEGMPEDSVTRLMNMVMAGRAAGAAVLWITTSRRCWSDKRLTRAKRFSIENDAWSSLTAPEIEP